MLLNCDITAVYDKATYKHIKEYKNKGGPEILPCSTPRGNIKIC